MDDQNDYSVAKEVLMTLFLGFVIGIIILVAGVGLIEFLKA